MNIFVLVKRTFDSEERIQLVDGQVSGEDATFVINPYDEFALEEALCLREAHGGTVTAVSLATTEAEKELRLALAMGADQAVLIDAENIPPLDPAVTANILANYLHSCQPDIVLVGNASIDSGSGQVGPRVAQLLHIPCITAVTALEVENGVARFSRDTEGAGEVLQTSLPFLMTCQQGLNEPRYPSLQGIMKAKKKPLATVDAVGFHTSGAASVTTVAILLPEKKQPVKILAGSLDEQVDQLVALVKGQV